MSINDRRRREWSINRFICRRLGILCMRGLIMRIWSSRDWSWILLIMRIVRIRSRGCCIMMLLIWIIRRKLIGKSCFGGRRFKSVIKGIWRTGRPCRRGLLRLSRYRLVLRRRFKALKRSWGWLRFCCILKEGIQIKHSKCWMTPYS